MAQTSYTPSRSIVYQLRQDRLQVLLSPRMTWRLYSGTGCDKKL
ncbi:unnamed protein product [Mycena citricolor]|uniref:Uncharacterized protein n=1 Tax=Mycena citricolor TaxID=2018698 RepID=A0AAD2K6F9_9AGAR|nr:unnamed protein product [Mycena citricolor]